MRRHLLYSSMLFLAAMALVTCSHAPDRAETGTQTPPLASPFRLARLDAGSMLVTDAAADAVCTVNASTLVPASCFSVSGSPLGIALTTDRIFVGNGTTQRVEVYDRGGIKLADLPGAFTSPASLKADEQHSLLFVLDTAARTISVLDLSGAPVRTITGDASGNGKLVNPVAITVDPVRQEVLVSDYGDVASSFPQYPARVRIYDYTGVFVTAISGSTGGFSRPQGLAVDNSHIFLTDGWSGQVLIFTRLTSTLTAAAGSLGTFGTGPGQLMLPLDVLVEPSTEDVYVTNNRPGRIERFAQGGIIP